MVKQSQTRWAVFLGCFIALLVAITDAHGVTVTIDAYVTFSMNNSNGVELVNGSVVQVIGSGDATIDGFPPLQGGLDPWGVQGDDMYIGTVYVSGALGAGTFYAGPFYFDSTVVSYLYIRVFDTNSLTGSAWVNWNVSDMIDVTGFNPSFPYLAVDFAPTEDINTTNYNYFVVIPEPGAAQLLFFALLLVGGLKAGMSRKGVTGSGRGPGRKGPRAAAGAAVLLLCLFAATLATAQTIPLHIGTTHPVKDEFGTNLRGTMLEDPALCDLVEIRWATNGIFAPATDGAADPRNPLVENGTSRMGDLTSPTMTNPGTFARSLSDPRPDPEQKLFVRVYNAPTVSEASFYGDSELVTVLSEPDAVYDVQVGQLLPLDPNDSDGDGLNNSWEKSLTSDPNNPDTDGDWMPDGEEFRAGTDLRDPNSLLAISAVSGIGPTWFEGGFGEEQLLMRPEDAIVEWQSVTGRQYRLEYTPDDLGRGPVYEDASVVVTATDTLTQVTVPGGMTNNLGSFRVKLVE